MNNIIIYKNDIGTFCNNIKEAFTVYGLKQKGKGFYVFDEIDEFSDLLKAYKPTILPPKEYLLPQQETLLHFDTQPPPHLIYHILPYVAFCVPKQCDTCTPIRYVINSSSPLPPSDLLQIF